MVRVVDHHPRPVQLAGLVQLGQQHLVQAVPDPSLAPVPQTSPAGHARPEAEFRGCGYPVADSATAAALRDELDFLLDVDPAPWAAAVAREFLAFVDHEREALRQRYRVSRNPPWAGRHVGNRWYLNERRFAWIHASQLGMTGQDEYFSRSQGAHLRELGLAMYTPIDHLTGLRRGPWIGMHPRMIAVYSCALANRIAQANALTPVTHDPRLFALPSDWAVDELGAALLQGPRSTPAPAASGQAAMLYACAAVQAMVPARIEHVPVERIVRARRTLSDEFDAFRAHLEGLAEEFAGLDSIEDLGILQSQSQSQSQLQVMVDGNLAHPSRELERGLRTLGMQPVRAAFGLKSLELPAVAALAAQAVHLSPVAGASGAITLQLYSSVRTARREAAEQQKSAAGYLLKLRRELDTARFLARARRALLRRP